MIRELFFLVFFSAASWLVGFLFYTLLNWKSNLINTFCWGIAVLFAVFHVIAYPMLKFGCSFSLLAGVFSVVLAALIFLSAWQFFKQKCYQTVLEDIRSGIREIAASPILFVLSVLLFGLLIYLCIFFYHPTRDDGYYLARSMEIIENNSLNVHPSVSWYGDYLDGYPRTTDASTLALFVSFFSYVFHLSPAILCRRGFAVLMIAAHFAAVLTAYDSVSECVQVRKGSRFLFLASYMIFLLFARKVNSAGVWLVYYVWQGKSILISLIFPLMLSSCCHLIQNADTSKPYEWISVAVVLIAGLFISTVGLFLPLILFFTYGVSFLLCTKFRYIKKMIVPALLAVLPVLVTVLISYYEVLHINTHYIGLGLSETWSWLEEFLRAEDLFQFLLFALSAVYILVKGSGTQKILFAAAPLILFVTFLNPLLAKAVSTYVTTPEVYFRLFWLLPVYFLPAFVLTDLLSRLFEDNLQKFVICVSGAFLMLFGFVSSEYDIIRPDLDGLRSLFDISSVKRENSYGISAKNMIIADSILTDWTGDRRPHILTKYDDYFELRQYSIDLSTRWESLYHAAYFDPDSGISESFFTDYDQMNDYGLLHALLEKTGTDYICLESPETDLSGFGFTPICQAENLTVWKVADVLS